MTIVNEVLTNQVKQNLWGQLFVLLVMSRFDLRTPGSRSSPRDQLEPLLELNLRPHLSPIVGFPENSSDL